MNHNTTFVVIPAKKRMAGPTLLKCCAILYPMDPASMR